MTKRVYSYGLGGPLAVSDKPELDYLNERFAQHGYKLIDLLRAIVLSPSFSDVTVPEAPVKSADASTAHVTGVQ